MKLVKGLAQNHPMVEVAYAPTDSFAKAFPKEVESQAKAFVQPTWASKMAEPEEGAPKKEEEVQVRVEHPGIDRDVLIAGICCSAAIFLCGLLTGWLLGGK